MMNKNDSVNSQKPKTRSPDPALLKNIRQIGMPSAGTKLYIEDSALSYLKYQLKKNDNRIIALIGSESKRNDTACLFVEGAIRTDDIYANGSELSFEQKAFSDLYEKMNTFFDGCILLGWYVPAYEMIRKYASALGENCRLFMLEDPTSQEEMFYIRDMGRVRKLGGYNIYYDRNNGMKNYLLSCKEDLLKENTERIHTNTESVQENGKEERSRKSDRKDHEKNEEQESFRITPFLYAASTVLAIVVLVVGITMMGNYEKMHDMQASLETLAKQVGITFSGGDADETENDADKQSPEATDAASEDSKTDAPAAEITENPAATYSPANGIDVVEYYVVKEGDTLAGISMKLYDSLDMVEKICEMNSIENEDSLYIGQKLYLPKE